MRVQLIVEAESPEELSAAAEAIASVMGEPDEGPEAAPAPVATDAPKSRRGGRKSGAAEPVTHPTPPPAFTPDAGAPPPSTSGPIAPTPASPSDPFAAASGVTLEQLSGLASAVIAKGKMTEALAASKAAGSSTGALSEVPPANYGALYAQLQALNA